MIVGETGIGGQTWCWGDRSHDGAIPNQRGEAWNSCSRCPFSPPCSSRGQCCNQGSCSRSSWRTPSTLQQDRPCSCSPALPLAWAQPWQVAQPLRRIQCQSSTLRSSSAAIWNSPAPFRPYLNNGQTRPVVNMFSKFHLGCGSWKV